MMEMRDVYDENKHRTGRIVPKGAQLNTGERILCVGCWIVNQNGEIFLTKRSPEKKFMPNKWENTGGHAMTGEDGKDAILREIYEEIGIRAERSEIVYLAEHTEETFFAEDYVLVKDYPLTDVVLQQGETCDAAWVSEERWEEMLRNGEIASSVNQKLQPHKTKLIEILHSVKRK